MSVDVNSNVTNELCRLMLVTPSSSLEVAVPSDVPLYDLLPTLLIYAGPDLADVGVEHDGWVLQRLGEPPLDEERTLAALSLRDGETVHLRPRGAELPALDFDDLITGVAEGTRKRPDRWHGAMTHRLFLGLSAASLVTGFLVLLQGGNAVLRGIAASVVVVLLLVGGALVGRMAKDQAAGAMLGLAAVPFAGLAGYLFAAVPGVQKILPEQVLAAGGAALVTVVLALVGISVTMPAFAAALVGAGALALGGLLSALADAAWFEAAGVVLVAALVFNVTVPMTSFRMADLRMQPLPANAEELQEDVEPLRAQRLMERAAVADHCMTALFTAVGVVCMVSLLVLAPADGWAPAALSAAACAALLLRSRVVLSAGQRMALLIPGSVGVALLLLRLSEGLILVARLGAMVTCLAAVAALCVLGARLLPGRRLLPYWGRAAEIVELLVGVSMLPLLLAVLDAYSWARNFVA
ncbi:type VII secretion integral membrane protein EccD [Streptomyces sp. NPDC058548]|uniref:type VII secretion integral membrane protein EccD n=1 Tax=unclassified Streptomyces TaxID=2593676 RepID=UPI003651F1A9